MDMINLKIESYRQIARDLKIFLRQTHLNQYNNFLTNQQLTILRHIDMYSREMFRRALEANERNYEADLPDRYNVGTELPYFVSKDLFGKGTNIVSSKELNRPTSVKLYKNTYIIRRIIAEHPHKYADYYLERPLHDGKETHVIVPHYTRKMSKYDRKKLEQAKDAVNECKQEIHDNINKYGNYAQLQHTAPNGIKYNRKITLQELLDRIDLKLQLVH